jgi:hypothetical protein
MISVRVNGKKIRIAILLNRKTTLTIGSTHSENIIRSMYSMMDSNDPVGGASVRVMALMLARTTTARKATTT